ncbi:GNAT family N-acetyltransferase [Halomonas aquamarina]|uniref:GNAT family N-acetyltransferase n=1 Tax=Vreelandella aquamarina TaxID=77097 RepID=A0ACC5VTG8_9GAMM|nr:GNAT family N-acetyltransferase [Halomonas aquamarina]MBZ5487168.1 GNAT family N-acetyltransferase [Halomonas aquamarina]
MTLRLAAPADLETVLSWLTTEHAFRMWAGPALRYPATPESAWSDLDASEQNARVLLNATGDMAAFGQLLRREGGVIHLARLVVDPALRGQGMGRALCTALMEEGASKQQVKAFTLKVFESNVPAFHLYQSLGFEPNGRAKTGAIFMVKPVAGS